ncbi:MAG: GlsB/YeaQ/YmgE family stress response membrane protein [Phormidesmis sp.]
MINILAWVILGVLAGAIAKAIYPGRQGGGFLATMILGIIGAFVGGLLHSLISGNGFALAAAGLSPFGVVLAVLGAIVTLFVYYTVTKSAA